MPDKIEIGSIMRKYVFSINYNDTIRKAGNLMKREGVRNIPVVHDRKYVGMITEREILKYSLKHLYAYDMRDI
jgi:predicted transcriptional regulator